ncbi:hypothetical protein GOODEAATRI_030088 [Goodea atripinnis]|uniref:Uncharacterized protein n=1 Tax=Goodea atripinnis TaxID=208336 RepID=A0ABV0MWB5_9TELE
MPYSCSCTTSYAQLETAERQSRPEGFTRPSDIYSKSCSHVLMCYVEHGFKISLVIIFGLFSIAVISFFMTINMIHQNSHHDSIEEAATALRLFGVNLHVLEDFCGMMQKFFSFLCLNVVIKKCFANPICAF